LTQERATANAQATWLDRQRYRPQQWADHKHWHQYLVDRGERWFGFDQVRGLHGLPPEILLVPLEGHTFGHAGVAIRTNEGWLLQAGDAYFHHGEMDIHRPHCTPGLRAYQWLMEQDRGSRLRNQQRLRELRRAHGTEVQVMSSHDPLEFEQLAHRGLSAAAPLLA
jgi:glyoxylase-like metal-dependent hydrolase (beta-lactamase superfamily II)